MPPAAPISHPTFARLWARVLARFEPDQITAHRRAMLEGLHGRVLEVGAGSGTNFPLYPPEVREVLAVEPEPYLRRVAEREATRAPVPVRVCDGTAEALPVPDASLDAVVVCLVLCSVDDQAVALAEARRALRPDGELRFYEHVAAPAGSARSRLQRAVDRTFWPHAFGNCHTHRDTGRAITEAGFTVTQRRELLDGGPLMRALPVADQLLGRARRA